MPHTPRLDVHALDSRMDVVAHNVNSAGKNGRGVPSSHLHNDESIPHTPIPPTSNIADPKRHEPYTHTYTYIAAQPISTHASQYHLPGSTPNPRAYPLQHPATIPNTQITQPVRAPGTQHDEPRGSPSSRKQVTWVIGAGQGRVRQHAMARRTYIYIYIYIYTPLFSLYQGPGHATYGTRRQRDVSLHA
jgi:hypothetical protein